MAACTGGQSLAALQRDGAAAPSCPLSGGCRPQGGWGLFHCQSGSGHWEKSRIDPTPTASRSPLGGGTRVWPPYGALASRCVECSRQLQERAGTAALPCTCDGALRVGYIGEGAFPLREQRISASPMRRFSPHSFWAARERRLWRSQVTAAAGQALAFAQTTCSANA